MIIGICGKMGTGKDYIASNIIIPYLENVLHQKSLKVCFADQIKINVMTKHNRTYDSLYENKSAEDRRLLQLEGTEHGRNVFGPDIWVKNLNNWIDVFTNRGVQHFVITDVRFKNELEFIRQRKGLLIKVDAPSRNNTRLMNESGGDMEVYDKIKDHASECDLDNVELTSYDAVINNDPECITEHVLVSLVNTIKDKFIEETGVLI